MTINSISFAGNNNNVEKKSSSTGKTIAAVATIGGGSALGYVAAKHHLNKVPLDAYMPRMYNFINKYEKKFGLGSIKNDPDKFNRFASKYISIFGKKLEPAFKGMKAFGAITGAALGGLVFAVGCGIKALFSRNKD